MSGNIHTKIADAEEAQIAAEGFNSCPFCGGEEQHFCSEPGWFSGIRYHVFCDDCFAHGGTATTKQGALAEWNDRHE